MRLQSLLVSLICLIVPLKVNAEDDPRLTKILESWKTAPEGLESCHISGRLFHYDHVFEKESRAEFRIHWDRRKKREFSTLPAEISPLAVSQILNRCGIPYQFEKSAHSKFIWSLDNTVSQIDWETRKETHLGIAGNEYYSALEHLNFAIHPALSKLTDKYEWQIKEEKKDCYELIGVRPYARGELSVFSQNKASNSENTQQVHLIVSKNDHSIRAVKLPNPAKTVEKVFVITKREFSPRTTTICFFDWDKTPRKMATQPETYSSQNPLYAVIEMLLP